MNYLLLVFIAELVVVESRIFIRDSISRTCLQTKPVRFRQEQQPFWWDDKGVWCSNLRQNLLHSTCGRCGDAHGIITGTYNTGQVFSVAMMQANNRGSFALELCPEETETDNCFIPLRVVGADSEVGGENIACTGESFQNRPLNVTIQLPDDVTCTRCTVRATYRTSHLPAPDACFDPSPAQTFRKCFDIRID